LRLAPAVFLAAMTIGAVALVLDKRFTISRLAVIMPRS
jgi:hypothetical protein